MGIASYHCYHESRGWNVLSKWGGKNKKRGPVTKDADRRSKATEAGKRKVMRVVSEFRMCFRPRGFREKERSKRWGDTVEATRGVNMLERSEKIGCVKWPAG